MASRKQASARSLFRYEAMCTAIPECHRVDEVKEIHDKARALEVYAKRAKNTEAERKACDIRLRAGRRAGKLLAELARVEPRHRAEAANALLGRSSHGETNVLPRKSDYAKALDDTGLSRQTAHRYQQLAAVPKETFEAALADPVMQGFSMTDT